MIRQFRHLILGLLALTAGPTLAADEPEVDYQRLYEETAILETLTRFKLNQAQAGGILEAQNGIYAELDAFEAAQRRMYLDTREATVRIEWALLKGTDADPKDTEKVARATERLASERERRTKAINKLLDKIANSLTKAQMALVETDQHRAAREQFERDRRKARNEARQESYEELTGWLRQASDADYRAERDTRVAAIVSKANPNTDPARLTNVSKDLTALYDQARQAQAAQFSELKRTLNERLGAILSPPQTAEETGQAYVLSQSEWIQFWQNRRTAGLLIALVPTLPAGGPR